MAVSRGEGDRELVFLLYHSIIRIFQYLRHSLETASQVNRYSRTVQVHRKRNILCQALGQLTAGNATPGDSLCAGVLTGPCPEDTQQLNASDTLGVQIFPKTVLWEKEILLIVA